MEPSTEIVRLFTTFTLRRQSRRLTLRRLTPNWVYKICHQMKKRAPIFFGQAKYFNILLSGILLNAYKHRRKRICKANAIKEAQSIVIFPFIDWHTRPLFCDVVFIHIFLKRRHHQASRQSSSTGIRIQEHFDVLHSSKRQAKRF